MRRTSAAGAVLLGAALLITGPVAAGSAATSGNAATTSPTAGGDVPAEFRRGRVLLVRPHRLDVVEAGRVLRRLPLDGELDLRALPGLLGDPEWAATPKPGQVRIAATIAQRPGSRVRAAAPGVTRVQLVSADDVPSRIAGTRAGLALTGVTVEAVTPAGGLAPPAADRASIRYTHRSTLDLRSTTLRSLGADGPDARPALEVGGESTLRLSRVRITDATTGLRLDGVRSATLDRVVVDRSRGEGVAIAGGDRVTVRGLTVRDNAQDGLAVRGVVRSLAVPGPVVATGNGGAGVELTDVRRGALHRITTGRNAQEGVHVRGARALTVTGVRSAGDVVGVLVSASSGVRLADVGSTGARAGVVVKGSDDVGLDRAVVTGATDEAVAVSGARLTVRRARISGPGEGVVVGDGANGVTLRDSRVEGERAAVRIGAGGRRVVVRHVVARSPAGVAVRSTADGLRVEDVDLTGEVAADLRAGSRVDRAVIRGGETAVKVAADTAVDLRAATITAQGTGISAGSGADVEVRGSSVQAHRATAGRVTFRGGNEVSALPLRWVGIAGCTALVLAVALEIVSKVRERGRRVEAPTHVLNRT